MAGSVGVGGASVGVAGRGVKVATAVGTWGAVSSVGTAVCVGVKDKMAGNVVGWACMPPSRAKYNAVNPAQ